MTTTPRDLGRELYALAHEADYLARQLPDPAHPAELPGLGTVARHLDKLNTLTSQAVAGVLLRTAEPGPHPEAHRQAVSALTNAAAGIGDAVSHLARAAQRLGFLHRISDDPGSTTPRNAEAGALAAVAQSLHRTWAALEHTSTALRTEADRILDPPQVSPATARATAARARSHRRPPPPQPSGPGQPTPPPFTSRPLPRRHP